MSRVDQAGPVSKILHYLFESYAKFSMCSYERVGWLCFRDVGFFNRDLAKRAGKFFPYKHFSPVTGMKGGCILRNSTYPMPLSWLTCCIFHNISIPFGLQ